jgi:hypothetical protein
MATECVKREFMTCHQVYDSSFSGDAFSEATGETRHAFAVGCWFWLEVEEVSHGHTVDREHTEFGTAHTCAFSLLTL